ncbi:MAG: hypothetical protein IKE03_01775, partial [Blautia sp.]|nr:hypothetical protein [Blautia sp.]
VQSQAPSQLRGQAQAPFVALKVRLALAIELLFHAPRSKCEVLTEQLPRIYNTNAAAEKQPLPI